MARQRPNAGIQPRPLAAGAFLGLIVGLLVAILTLAGVLDRAAWTTYDALFELRGPQVRPDELAIVELDEASLAQLGVWPLPRTIYARLIDDLVAAGARVVALDVTFPQAQSPATDRMLGAAIARHPGQVVLAANLQALRNDLAGSQTIVLPTPALAAGPVGIVNLEFDVDGGIHRFRPWHQVVDPLDPRKLRPFEGFDLAIARAAGQAPQVPTTSGDWLINFVGPPRWVRTLSLASVMDAAREHNATILSLVKGRIVLVGATSTRLQDQYPTPFSTGLLGSSDTGYMAGVEIHANAVHTLLHDDPIRSASDGIRLAALVGLALVAGAVLTAVSPWQGLALALALALLQWGLSLWLFGHERVWFDPAAPTLALALVFVGGVIQHFRRAESARRFYRRTFERYVAKDIVDEVLRNPGLAPKLGGERREVTVLFSDIRSFTTISEQRTPEQVVEFLNAYLTAMADVIHANQGCIDKYIGDAILALWGNVKPMTPAESAVLGVRTALGMARRVAELRPVWEARGYPRIDIGIGVNTGEAVVGNIGSPEKLEFGVIGDSINVASRLEGLTKDYGGAIVISGRTRELLGERFDCTFLATVKVKGRAAPVDIFRVDAERV